MGLSHEHKVQLVDIVSVDASFASHCILSLYWPVHQNKEISPVRALECTFLILIRFLPHVNFLIVLAVDGDLSAELKTQLR